MIGVLVYIKFRYGETELDRFFKIVLYIFPLSYFLLAIGGVCFLVETGDSRRYSRLINCVINPVCEIIMTAAEIMIATEMQIMRSNLVSETLEKYKKSVSRVKIMRNLFLAILLISNSL